MLAVVVVVVLAEPAVFVPVVVGVVGEDAPFVVVEGAVPVDPATGLVVVVVVLHTPRRCASGPHVDVVESNAVSSAALAV